MADGAIRIKTEIDVKQANSSLMSLENSIKKSADKIASLKSQMDTLKNTKIPTKEYQDISAQIDKANERFDKLLAKQEQMQALGKTSGTAWDKLSIEMDEVGNEIQYAKGELQDLVDTGKAFTLGTDSKQFADLGKKLEYEEDNMAVKLKRHDELIAKQKKAEKGYKSLSDSAKKAFNKMDEGAKKSGGLLATFASRLKGIALSLLVFNWITKAFNAMVQAIKEGFTNMYNGCDGFKSKVDSLKASCTTLKNAFAAAFSPLVEIAIPYIQTFIEWLTKAINLFGQFVAALTGRKTYTKAVKQSAGASEEAAAATKKEAEATEEAEDAMKGQLSSLDKLNVLTSNKNNKSADTSTDTGAGGGGTAQMFEEVPIDSKILDFIQKMKDMLAPVLAYAKELKDVFIEGFFDGLGDWQYRWESIKESMASIKESLVDIFTDKNVVKAADKWAKSFVKMLGQIVGSIASIGLTIATNLIGGFAKYLEQNKQKIKDYLVSMFDIGAEINTMIGEFATAIAYVFEAFATEDAQQLTANIMGVFSSAFMGVTELATKFFRDIVQIITQPFVDNQEAFRTALEGYLSVFSEVTGTIKQGIDDIFAKLNETYDEHFKPFFDSVSQGLTDLTSKILDFWNSKVQPVLDEWATKFDTLWAEHLQPMFDKLAGVLGSIADLFKVLWETVLMPLFTWIVENVFPILLPLISGTFDFIMTVIGCTCDLITGLLGVIQGLVDTVVNLIEGDWTGAWESAQSIVESIWEAITSVIETGIEWITSSINSMLEMFNGIDFSGMFGGIFGGSSTTVTYATSADTPDYPGYATGQVIPKTMKKHLAWLGDNNQETEIVSPLSTMKQAMLETLREYGMMNNSGSSDGDTVVNIDGNEVFRAVRKQNEEYKKQTGKSAFA